MELLEERQTRGYEGVRLGEDFVKCLALLEPVDRKLLEMTLGGRLSRREAALLTGLAVGTVSRRVRAVMRRLADPLVVALMREGKLLPELHQEIGLEFFLHRVSVPEISRRWGLSQYEVRRMITYIRGWQGAPKNRNGESGKRRHSDI